MARPSLHVLIAGCVGIACFAILLIAPRAEAQETTRFTATIMAAAIDVNGDGMTGDTGTGQIRGPFGRGVTKTYFEFLPWDEMTFCDATFTSISFVYHVATEVRTYPNGDQLYLSLRDGSLCLNLVDLSYTSKATLDVTGGTGKFQGAKGSSTQTGSGQVVEPDPVRLSAASGTAIDDIVLAE
jgi:hypothetical protein